jgi:D-sedoheptulose 7-phosphate isomerase
MSAIAGKSSAAVRVQPPKGSSSNGDGRVVDAPRGIRAESERARVEFTEDYLRRSSEILALLPAAAIATFIEITRAARDEGNQLLVCGNGGSAATASHFASGLGKDGSFGREHRFRALCLNDNVAWITSLANDTDYSQIFVEQLKNHARPGDVLVAFSSSGNSPNVLRATEWANENGLITVGVTGGTGGELGRLSQHCVGVGSDHMGHVEEAHFLIQHLVTYYFLEAEG